MSMNTLAEGGEWDYPKSVIRA